MSSFVKRLGILAVLATPVLDPTQSGSGAVSMPPISEGSVPLVVPLGVTSNFVNQHWLWVLRSSSWAVL